MWRKEGKEKRVKPTSRERERERSGDQEDVTSQWSVCSTGGGVVRRRGVRCVVRWW